MTLRRILKQPHLWVWLFVSAIGCVLLSNNALNQLREAFETDARISHRLLSQRTVQHEAVLATLALLQPAVAATGQDSAVQRLTSVYPQVLGVSQRPSGARWEDSALDAAEAASRSAHMAALAHVDFSPDRARYQLLLAAEPASYALLIDVKATVPWAEWSMPVATSPVRVSLEHAGQTFVVQPGQNHGTGWRFEFRKHLASASQPFDVVAVRDVGWQELPWLPILVWLMATSTATVGWAAWQRQRLARHRAEELLRVGQVSRLNALGELAAGMAHELNQPLTAILANTQAAQRLLNEEPLELDTAQRAMDQTVTQARRAADVLGRLRRMVEQPGTAQTLEPLVLETVAQAALALLEPDCRQRNVHTSLQVEHNPRVLADRIALEQIIHNLLTNALQAMDLVAADRRHLTVGITLRDQLGELSVSDSGPGIAPEAMPRVFEPFFSTREGGLGLGLSLCETLATGMGGQLRAEAHAPQGARFVLTLPLDTTPTTP